MRLAFQGWQCRNATGTSFLACDTMCLLFVRRTVLNPRGLLHSLSGKAARLRQTSRPLLLQSSVFSPEATERSAESTWEVGSRSVRCHIG